MKRFFFPPYNFLFVFLIIFSMTGCKSYYIVTDFDSRTADHKTFAVLPFEMVFTGTIPQKLTAEDVLLIEEAESKAFMISFYNQVLRSTHRGRNPIRVDIQHYDKTLSLLTEHELNIRSSWKEDPGKLAAILGVDAVVKGRIEKHRFMSDLASYGIDLGVYLMSILSDHSIWFWLPSDLSRSNKIKTNYSLLDRNGHALWSIAYDVDTDWREPANEVIESINRKSVRRFPYR